ncbi:V-type ATPase subunit [Persephonella atlantica]|uniref:V-type ATPase subunit n=1 Tax=Persephonella atlantica TaxID=2699429 RepID=A0ABS1GIF3_9AQUI|nr:V-type ATPase subunit [Persephonella atlantica]MBK3332660.1 V-type ATPase subunit [Persephonella atlantica]
MINPVRFSSLNAKVRTKKSFLIRKEDINRLIRSGSPGDVYFYLKSSDYGSYIKEYSLKGVFSGLDRYFYHLIDELSKSLSRPEKDFIILFFIEREKLEEKKIKYKTEQNYYYFVRKIDLNYINKIRKALKKLSISDRADVKSIAGSYYDLYNLFTAVRLRIIYRLPPEDIIPLIVPFGYRFSLKDFFYISKTSSLSEISHYLSSKIDIKFDDFVSLRKGMYRYHLNQISRVWYGYPFRFSVPFGFLRLKEIEIMNIRAVLEGVYYRLSPEEISKMVVYDDFS